MATPTHWIERDGRSFAILSRRGIEIDGIETIGSAEDHLAELDQELADQIAADAAAIEADAYEAALDRAREAVNALGGYVAPGDHASAGYVRGIGAALAAIDAIGMGACEDRRAA